MRLNFMPFVPVPFSFPNGLFAASQIFFKIFFEKVEKISEKRIKDAIEMPD